MNSLKIEYPLEHWSKHAFYYAKKLNLPIDFIEEAKCIVVGAFGLDWLNNIFSKEKQSNSFMPYSPHQLEFLFRTANESQVVTILELAIYLKRLIKCKNLPIVIDIMKNSYYSGFMQLAYAYRFMKNGAEELELEPITQRGKSDIYFKYNNLMYLIECYCPKLETNVHSSYNLHKAFDIISEKCNEFNKVVRVKIKLNKSISIKEGKIICYKIANSIENYHSGQKVEFDISLAKIIIEDIDNTIQDDLFNIDTFDLKSIGGKPDWGTELTKVNNADISKIRLGEKVNKIRESRILVWEPMCDKKNISDNEYIDLLIEKVGRKIEQTKIDGKDFRRLVIANANPGPGAKTEIDEDSIRIIKTVQHAFVQKYDGFSGIILSRRSWQNTRYRLQGVLATGKEEYAFPEELYNRIIVNEDKNDFLWDYK